jgi:hypothetical protein
MNDEQKLAELIDRAGVLIGCDPEYRSIACIEVALDIFEKREAVVEGLAARVAAQSELLSKRAEK